jgi:antitoxin component YwqK of YwqJK toxin-antitoxin module
MYKKTLLFTSLAIAGVSCQNDKSKHIVQERFIHKYGYDVSPDEWNTHSYPGQVLTTKRNGQVTVQTFEDNHLHGPVTVTWPHSQTIKSLEEYTKGSLKRRVEYSIRGVPEKESLFLANDSILTTKWYASGTPFSKETIKSDTLISGEYYSPTNELEAKIENGSGQRLIRDVSGIILSKETFKNYQVVNETLYHPNKTPKTIAAFRDGQKHGAYKTFSEDGAPLKVENYKSGELEGLSTYYQNAMKYLEVQYVQGLKHGVQKRFVDGTVCIETSQYNLGQKHGATIVYCDGTAKTTWHFNNQMVSKGKYEELLQRDQVIAAMQ